MAEVHSVSPALSLGESAAQTRPCVFQSPISRSVRGRPTETPGFWRHGTRRGVFMVWVSWGGNRVIAVGGDKGNRPVGTSAVHSSLPRQERFIRSERFFTALTHCANPFPISTSFAILGPPPPLPLPSSHMVNFPRRQVKESFQHASRHHRRRSGGPCRAEVLDNRAKVLSRRTRDAGRSVRGRRRCWWRLQGPGLARRRSRFIVCSVPDSGFRFWD